MPDTTTEAVMANRLRVGDWIVNVGQVKDLSTVGIMTVARVEVTEWSLATGTPAYNHRDLVRHAADEVIVASPRPTPEPVTTVEVGTPVVDMHRFLESVTSAHGGTTVQSVAQDQGVSIGTAREALERLVHMGMVVPLPSTIAHPSLAATAYQRTTRGSEVISHG